LKMEKMVQVGRLDDLNLGDGKSKVYYAFGNI